ncbi:MAG TPA: hypothetical protein VLL52_12285 [Anaerolineae bacterium]|nr:hypothetical protein [Anaerolineae bacterium]
MNISDLLTQYRDETGIGDAKLANKAQDIFPDWTFHRSNIRNWREGYSKTVRDWQPLVVLGYIMQLEKDVMNDILYQNGHESLKQLQVDAPDGLSKVFDFWLLDHLLQHDELDKSTITTQTKNIQVIDLIRNVWQVILFYKKFAYVVIIGFVFLVTIYGIYNFFNLATAGQTGWYVNSFENDDVDAIFINNQLVDVSYRDFDLGWVNVNPYLVDDNIITLAHLNGPSFGKWHFELRYDGDLVFIEKNETDDDYSTLLVRQLEIQQNVGHVREVPIPNIFNPQVDDTWAILINADDVGFVLVNGYVAVGAYNSGFGDFDFQDISQFIKTGENKFEIVLWNFEEWFYYDVTIIKNDDILWRGRERSNSNNHDEQTGQVKYLCLIIVEDNTFDTC